MTVVVTGAFSYTGKYATRRLLARGYKVKTLTFHPSWPNEFGGRVEVHPYNFENPRLLEQSLRGASALINTYWVRFPHGALNFEMAVRNTRTLIECAKRAGVRRIVHVSIANPALDSQLAYYRGKAELEQAVMDSGVAYTILRPTVIFGFEDILINNIAWFVRRFPAFGIPGDGRYQLRPIFVEDMAKLMVEALSAAGNEILDAVGPETFTFEELVRLTAAQLDRTTTLVHLPVSIAYAVTSLIGWCVGDVVLTWQEYKGLMSGLLATGGPATGETKLSHWLAENRGHVGQRYASEVARHFAKLEANP